MLTTLPLKKEGLKKVGRADLEKRKTSRGSHTDKTQWSINPFTDDFFNRSNAISPNLQHTDDGVRRTTSTRLSYNPFHSE